MTLAHVITQESMSAQCQCDKCVYERDPASFVARVIDLHSLPSSLTRLIAIGDAYMQDGLYRRAVEAYVEVILAIRSHRIADADIDEGVGVIALGDVYHALGTALVECGSWREGHLIWCLGFIAFPAHKFLQEAHSRLTEMVVFAGQPHLAGNPAADICEYFEFLKSSQICADDFVSSQLRLRGCLPCYSGGLVTTSNKSIEHSWRPINQSVSRIYLSKCAVLTPSECAWVILEAERHAASSGAGWTTSRHYAVPTTDLPVYAIPDVCAWFGKLMVDLIGPLLTAAFTLPSQNCCNVSVLDAFIVKYSVPIAGDKTTAAAQRYLPLHVDQSTHSMVISLNSLSSYQGGGTFFADLGSSIRIGDHALVYIDCLLYLLVCYIVVVVGIVVVVIVCFLRPRSHRCVSRRFVARG